MIRNDECNFHKNHHHSDVDRGRKKNFFHPSLSSFLFFHKQHCGCQMCGANLQKNPWKNTVNRKKWFSGLFKMRWSDICHYFSGVLCAGKVINPALNLSATIIGLISANGVQKLSFFVSDFLGDNVVRDDLRFPSSIRSRQHNFYFPLLCRGARRRKCPVHNKIREKSIDSCLLIFFSTSSLNFGSVWIHFSKLVLRFDENFFCWISPQGWRIFEFITASLSFTSLDSSLSWGIINFSHLPLFFL